MPNQKEPLNSITPITPHGMISSSYARALWRTVAEQGFDAEAFVGEEGLSIAEVERASYLPTPTFGRLYQRAMILLKDESLGMVSGGKVASGTFRMLCLCVIHCATLEDIIQRASEFFDVCNSILVKPRIIHGHSTISITFTTVKGEEQQSVDEILQTAGPVKVRTSLYMWQSLLGWFAGNRIPLQCVEFAFAEPENGSRWSQLFSCPVYFNKDESLFKCDSDVLSLPNVQTEKTLAIFLKAAPYPLIAPMGVEQTLSDRVTALFGQDLSQGLPSAGVMSKRLGMSVSTLRRQLDAEGVTYQQLKDDCRRAAAIQYLSSERLSITEVAGLLGFDESSAFFRAFKRWTGQTPAQYRKSL